MRMVLAAVAALAVVPAFCADWNPRLAAEYLDSREKEWIEWPTAKTTGGACLSCHTGVPYLLARPSLRRALGEAAPTSYETSLLDAVKARLAIAEPQGYSATAMGVESVLTALLLASDDAQRGQLSAETEKAFARMWSLQQTTGDTKGAWRWYSLNLDPWEMPESNFFGASLAALAAGTAPGDYQSRPPIQENLAALRQFLRAGQKSQPLHNRLVLLWASTRLRDTLSDADRGAILDEVRLKQQPDGGWTLESLGTWKPHAAAPPAPTHMPQL